MRKLRETGWKGRGRVTPRRLGPPLGPAPESESPHGPAGDRTRRVLSWVPSSAGERAGRGAHGQPQAAGGGGDEAPARPDGGGGLGQGRGFGPPPSRRSERAGDPPCRRSREVEARGATSGPQWASPKKPLQKGAQSPGPAQEGLRTGTRRGGSPHPLRAEDPALGEGPTVYKEAGPRRPVETGVPAPPEGPAAAPGASFPFCIASPGTSSERGCGCAHMAPWPGYHHIL
ncbi:collagen alpha-1(I) chain-like [Sarcophilus harrisii]|uniref:collagen alpha-1(I) chain-like n=1 Tax=Sarcophilus harrisii TaxID=9305 RepID=UPI001302026F|nr:collagen alpha-1(I) chain-like [Sarcophilus harrisii]